MRPLLPPPHILISLGLKCFRVELYICVSLETRQYQTLNDLQNDCIFQVVFVDFYFILFNLLFQSPSWLLSQQMLFWPCVHPVLLQAVPSSHSFFSLFHSALQLQRWTHFTVMIRIEIGKKQNKTEIICAEFKIYLSVVLLGISCFSALT